MYYFGLTHTTIRNSLLFLLVVTLSAFFHFGPWVVPFDDAFIHFRTALNWVQYGRPYFNINEPIFSCSSPLWLMLLSFGTLLGIPILIWAKILNSLLSVIAAWCWSSQLGKGWSRAVYGLALWSVLLPVSSGLMETPLALVLLEIGLCRTHLQLPIRIGVILLATMTRLECVVALLFPFLEGLAQVRVSQIKTYLFPLCVLSGYLIFSYYYYGVPLPQTLAAKRIVYDIPSSTIVSQLLLSFIGEDAPPYLTTILYTAIALLTCLGALTPLVCKSLKVERRILAPALFSVIVFSGYCLNHVLLFPWYIPLITVPVFYTLIKQLSDSSQVVVRIFTVALSAIYFLPLVRFSVSEAYNHQSSPWFPSNDRTKMLSEIARAIPADKLVAAPEIGAIGYSTSARIIDGIGLATPQALRFHPLAIPSQRANGLIGAIPFALVAETNPDIIIGVSGLIEGSEEKYVALSYHKTEYPVFRPEDEAHHSKLSYLSRQKIYVWEKN